LRFFVEQCLEDSVFAQKLQKAEGERREFLEKEINKIMSHINNKY